MTSLGQQLAIASQQQQLSRETLASLREQLDIVRRQHEEEQARLARRPRVEIDLAGIAWEALQSGKPIRMPFEDGRFALVAIVRNVGDAVLKDPIVMFRAAESSVSIQPNEFTRILDLIPFSFSGSGYTFKTTINVPEDLNSFTLRVRVLGSNHQTTEVNVPIIVDRPPSKEE